MLRFCLFLVLVGMLDTVGAQVAKSDTMIVVTTSKGSDTLTFSGADTLHYRKVYYFGGTGIAVPLGRTKNVYRTALFTGSMGLDISLQNPKYFLLPTLYTMAFRYNQSDTDEGYNTLVENARSSLYNLSLAGGIRRQLDRLNTYVYFGPALSLAVEPRVAAIQENVVRMQNSFKFSPAVKVGAGADYKFPGFFLCFEMGYFRNFRQIQSQPVNALTMMVGLKSDITSFSGKVVKVINTVSNVATGSATSND